MKRARPDSDEADPSTLPYASLLDLFLRRDALARYSNAPFFEKLVSGRWVRCSVGPGAPARLLHVLGVGEPLAEARRIEFSQPLEEERASAAAAAAGCASAPAGGGAPPPTPREGGGAWVATGAQLRLFDHTAGRAVPHAVPLAFMSNTPPTAEEWAAVARAAQAQAQRGGGGGGGGGPRLPAREDHQRLVEEWARITRAAREGRGCVVAGVGAGGAVGARLWGSGGGGGGAAAGGVRLAVIVPYRDTPGQGRAAQLARFAAFMPAFLRSPAVSPPLAAAHVLVVEQSSDGFKFNRGKVLNAGVALLSTREGRASLGLPAALVEEGFTAFCLHDVDLLPAPALGAWYAASPA